MDALVPTAGELVGQINQGFQDYIDKEVAEADRVDVNTTEYRYMGYMTQLRKAVELVWIYPVDALRRGWQGQGTCHFTIEKDGRVRQVKVASSTGYDALDRAFVEAVRMAAIPPLPASFDRARFPVNFDYRYVISGSAH
jgi:TonB family protein